MPRPVDGRPPERDAQAVRVVGLDHPVGRYHEHLGCQGAWRHLGAQPRKDLAHAPHGQPAGIFLSDLLILPEAPQERLGGRGGFWAVEPGLHGPTRAALQGEGLFFVNLGAVERQASTARG